jgi:hypothetical protein
MKNANGLSVIEKAKQMQERYGLDEALQMADSLAQNSAIPSQRLWYSMIQKALLNQEVAEEIK